MPIKDTRKTSRNADARPVRDILAQCKSKDVQLVRFLYCGNDSVIRGKACHTEFLESYLRSGDRPHRGHAVIQHA